MTKLVIGLAVFLAIVFGSSWYVKAQDKIPESNGQNSLSNTAQVLNIDQSTWGKLRDQDNLFEVKYPKNILKKVSRQVISPLPNREKIKSVGLEYLLPIEHCSNISTCTPTTTNISIDFFTVSKNFNDVFKDLQKSYGQDMPVITVDDHQGIRFTLGSKKEGVVYTVVPVSNDKTLFILRAYLSEDFYSNHEKISGFIKSSDQKTLFDQMLSTFTFRPSI